MEGVEATVATAASLATETRGASEAEEAQQVMAEAKAVTQVVLAVSLGSRCSILSLRGAGL